MPTIALREVQDRPARCRSCNAPVKWAITAAGKSICLEQGAPTTRNGDEIRVDNAHVHFANCPNADQHRRTPPPNARKAETEARAAAPMIAQLEHDVKRARELMEHQRQRADSALEALRRLRELAKTADRAKLAAEIAHEIARLEAPRSEDVYPPSTSSRPRYAGD